MDLQLLLLLLLGEESLIVEFLDLLKQDLASLVLLFLLPRCR